MVKQTRNERIPGEMPQVQANRRFRNYRKGQHGAMRDMGIADDPKLQRAMKAWEEFVHRDETVASRLMKGIDFSPEDVQRFCLIMKDFEGEVDFTSKTGPVVSLMINSSSHGRFLLSLDHLDTRLKDLCEGNRKDVVIRGHVGLSLGYRMERGSILLEGDAGHNLGEEMEGGSIVVNGDVGEKLGYGMKGGLITVNGDAGKDPHWWGFGTGYGMGAGMIIVNGFAHGRVGEKMSGGEIHLNGDYGDIDRERIISGRIFHKGKLMVDK
jgi:hypothetical protein